MGSTAPAWIALVALVVTTLGLALHVRDSVRRARAEDDAAREKIRKDAYDLGYAAGVQSEKLRYLELRRRGAEGID